MPVETKNLAENLSEMLRGHREAILGEWLAAMSNATRRSDLINESELRSQCGRFLNLVSTTAEAAGSDLKSSAWNETREMLAEVRIEREKRLAELEALAGVDVETLGQVPSRISPGQ